MNKLTRVWAGYLAMAQSQARLGRICHPRKCKHTEHTLDGVQEFLTRNHSYHPQTITDLTPSPPLTERRITLWAAVITSTETRRCEPSHGTIHGARIMPDNSRRLQNVSYHMEKVGVCQLAAMIMVNAISHGHALSQQVATYVQLIQDGRLHTQSSLTRFYIAPILED